MQKLDKTNFTQTIENSEKTILIDFYADWCGPCRMLSPIIEEFAKENPHDAEVYKVDVDASPDIAAAFNIMSIPSLISFKNGQVYKRTMGVLPKEKLLEMVI